MKITPRNGYLLIEEKANKQNLDDKIYYIDTSDKASEGVVIATPQEGSLRFNKTLSGIQVGQTVIYEKGLEVKAYSDGTSDFYFISETAILGVKEQ